MNSQPTALDAIAVDAPDLAEDDVANAVAAQFGLTGEYSRLVSERDQNFMLKAVTGDRFVVKVTSALESAAATDFQIEGLLHIEKTGGVSAPVVVRTLDGHTSGSIADGENTLRLRVVTWLEGEQLAEQRMGAGLAGRFGDALAKLDQALSDYSHPGENPVLLWDLQRAAELREVLDTVNDRSVHDRISRAIEDFEQRVMPAMSGLRFQVIHGDANPENVLLGDDTIGFIDFGDMLRAPLVFDVAIAASYLRSFDDDPLQFIVPFVAGYHSNTPLSEMETGLLFDLIRARLATTVSLLYWRLSVREEDDPYRKKALELESGAEEFLERLDALGRREFMKKLYNIQ